MKLRALAVLALLSLTACAGPSSEEADRPSPNSGEENIEPAEVRVATFNASLYGESAGALTETLSDPASAHPSRVAETLQRVRPDVVLLNEFDRDSEGQNPELFQRNFLSTSQNGADPIEYPYVYAPETNTGVHSGADLDNNGETDSTPGDQSYGNDAYGFGEFPGQYGFVILSKYPIDTEATRTFQTFLWKEMPDSLLPTDFYSQEAIDALRLSSKTHVDVPVEVDGHTLHVLASHPTPPSFDGPEDRNGRRNHDEIRFWRDYVTPGAGDYIYDDSGEKGGLDEESSFVILGDLNSDPYDGDSRHEAVQDLLASERVQDPKPTSQGAIKADEHDGQMNNRHESDALFDTADFSDRRVGNLRVDYVLPSADVKVTDSEVFWPAPSSEFAALADVSDHHLVWVDLTLSE